MNAILDQWGQNEPYVLRAPAPTTDRQQESPRSTRGETTGERSYAAWFAQRTWEDDGGRGGQGWYAQRERNTVRNTQRLAIVITHTGVRDPILEMPWLETDYQIDESDWIVLSSGGWYAVAEGDPAIWDALERKLLVGFYVSQPELIAVIGHASEPKANVSEKDQVRRIVSRVRSLLLPAAVVGFWTDERGSRFEILEPANCASRSRFEFADGCGAA